MTAPPARTDADGMIAAWQSAGIILLTGLLALIAIPVLDEPWQLTVIPAAAVVTAGVILVLPWRRWSRAASAWLCVPSFALLGAATWVFEGFTAGTGPFYVLVFAWLGLHHSVVVVALWSLPAAVSHVVALEGAEASAHVVGSTFVLMPVAVGVGVLISRHVSALDDARDLIAAEERWRSAMMATLAHDVRSPLTSVAGALELLADSPEIPTRLRPVLASAVRQTHRINRLATGLLELDRVEQGQLRLELAAVGFRELALEVAEITSPSEVEVNADADLFVWADRERLEQILVNLTNNALRHGRPPVVLSAHHEGDSVIIQVRDHGAGVAEEDVASLFSKFSSADKSPGSVGLGLWIVKLLAEAHGGSVVYERVQPGACFTVNLPGGPVDATAVTGRRPGR